MSRWLHGTRISSRRAPVLSPLTAEQNSSRARRVRPAPAGRRMVVVQMQDLAISLSTRSGTPLRERSNRDDAVNAPLPTRAVED